MTPQDIAVSIAALAGAGISAVISYCFWHARLQAARQRALMWQRRHRGLLTAYEALERESLKR